LFRTAPYSIYVERNNSVANGKLRLTVKKVSAEFLNGLLQEVKKENKLEQTKTENARKERHNE
jgi:hypothetical protein